MTLFVKLKDGTKKEFVSCVLDYDRKSDFYRVVNMDHQVVFKFPFEDLKDSGYVF